MKLILVNDNNEYLDHVGVADDEWDYAQQDDGAASVLLGSLANYRREAGPAPYKIFGNG
jgi:hypothetical protein